MGVTKREGTKICHVIHARKSMLINVLIAGTNVNNWHVISRRYDVRCLLKKGVAMKVSTETRVNRYRHMLERFEGVKQNTPFYNTLSSEQKKDVETSILYCQERINEMTYNKLMHEARG